ncbi:MAG: alpha/beta hydrolase [Anaerolineales bacterium]
MIPPPLHFGDQGPLLHFLHANGYPPEAYRTFLFHFGQEYKVIASYLRPLWPGTDPLEVEDWIPFREDLLHSLRVENRTGGRRGHIGGPDEKVIGVGHSIGGTVTLMAALKSPELFQTLVLIEPVLFPSWMSAAFRVLSNMDLLLQVHPLIRRTLNRKRVFDSEEAMYENYRGKKVFQRVPDAVLWDYVHGLGHPRPDERIELAYPPEWEVKIYQTGGVADHLIWPAMRGCKLPVLLIRGEMSDTLYMSVVRRMKRHLPQLAFVNMGAVGHLAPLEAPRRVYDHVRTFLRSLSD